MICIIDYNVGNLFSLSSSLNYIGTKSIISNNVSDIKKADKLILPGVGAFQMAREKLKVSGRIFMLFSIFILNLLSV